MSTDTFPDRCLDDYPTIYRKDFLKGKYAFITGGGSGINFRITEGLMRHGCNVAIASRSIERVKHASNELNNKIGKYNNTKCIYFAMNIISYDQVSSVINNILSNYFPKIDILINGAAGNFLCQAKDLSSNAFKRVLEIDTLGTFNATHAVFNQYMGKLKSSSKNINNKYKPSDYNGGIIVNISATLGYTGTMLQIHSSSAKAAVDSMTRVLCNEWGRYNVRVVGIAPGPIKETAGYDKLGGFLPDSITNKGWSKIPLQRAGTKKEIADSVLYLVSDAASYVSGEILVVDGGAWLKSSNELGDMFINNPEMSKYLPKREKSKNRSKL